MLFNPGIEVIPEFTKMDFNYGGGVTGPLIFIYSSVL